MIFTKPRDPRFITVRRGGTLSDTDHHLLALWAATCAEHVLHFFEEVQPKDDRPRQAIEQVRAWVRGEVTMSQSRAAGGHAMGAARALSGAARHAAFAAGQAAVVAHVAAHELGAAAYAISVRRGGAACLWESALPGASAEAGFRQSLVLDGLACPYIVVARILTESSSSRRWRDASQFVPRRVPGQGVGIVDPVSLIVAALVAGASEAVKDTATQALKDAYAALRRVLGRKAE